jgi:hypothetical protein
MAAGKASNAIVVELFVEPGVRFTDLVIENVAEGGH